MTYSLLSPLRNLCLALTPHYVSLRLLLAGSGIALLTSGCGTYAPALSIDRSIQAKSQNSRVEFIVLHYTSANSSRSLKILSEQNVSSHYLVTDARRPHIYQLVDENRRAWHAGLSQWYGRTDLNASSIGIEIVNEGRTDEGWAPYPPAQIGIVIALLKDIIGRHQIKPPNIVGHSDIAPQRKTDPGPLFPWKQLAAAGIGRWYDAARAYQYEKEFLLHGMPDIAWIQAELARVGYAVPRNGELDKATRNVLAAFQMHFRPSRCDGMPDAETVGILKALP